jgi:WD40 repeat protein
MSYDGFISYSHAADDLLAPRLQSALQRFAKPWWKRRAVRIFRDESSLSANPHLWSSITEALDTSGWFVLLLSPDAARSEWVNQEISYWAANRDPKKILPVVTDGTFGWADDVMTGTAVPEALLGVFTEEPRWVDLRGVDTESELDLQNPEFAAAVADIASAIRGIPKDELASEEVRQHRRTVRTAWSAGLVTAALAVAAIGFGIQSARNADEAERQAAIAAEQATIAEANADRAQSNAEAEAAARAEADASAEESGTNAALAQARELAASAVGVVDEDPRLATWLALTAIDQTPAGDVQPVEVINALWEAVAADPLEATIDLAYGGNTFVDLSPDGRLLAISSAEGAVLELRDAITFGVVWSYSEETEDGFARPVFSPDGSLIAIDIMDSTAEDAWRSSGVDDLPNRVVILDVATGEPETVLEFPECTQVWAPEWSPDGRQLAVSPGFSNGCERAGIADPIWIEVFDTDSWESLGIISIPGEDAALRAIYLDDRRLGAFRSHNPLQVYDATTFELVEVLEEVTSPVTPGVSIGGGLIAAHSNETLLSYVYDLDSGSQLDVLGQVEAWPNIPFGIAFSEDGRLIGYATDGRVLVWDTSTGEQTHRLTSGAGSSNLAFSNDGSRLYSAHRDGVVRVWDLSPGGSVIDGIATFPAGSFVNGNNFDTGTEIGTIVRFEFVPDFVTFIEFFSTSTGELVPPPFVTDDPVVLLPNDLIVGRPQGSDRYELYDPLTGLGTPLGPDCGALVCDVVRSVDRSEFAIVVPREDGQQDWYYFDSSTSEQVGAQTFDDGDLFPDMFADGWRLVAGRSGDLVFKDDNGNEILRLLGGGRPEVSHDGRLIAIRPTARTIALIDTATWETTDLGLEFGRMRGLAFGPDDSMLAVADEDQIHIVNIPEQLVVQEIQIALVSDFHWIDDSTLLMGDRAGSFWGLVSLDVDVLIDRARQAVADRPLTAQECATYRIDPCPAPTEGE